MVFLADSYRRFSGTVHIPVRSPGISPCHVWLHLTSTKAPVYVYMEYSNMAYLALSALELTLSQGKYNNVLIRLCFMATWQACLLSNKRGVGE